jgi:alpha-glucosidase (family GH31 glycosyl hydrolase)
MNSIERRINGLEAIKVTFLTENIARVQLSRDGTFGQSALNRYGFILEPKPEKESVAVTENGDSFTLQTGAAKISWDGKTLTVDDMKRNKTVLEQTGFSFAGKSAAAAFAATPEEDWAGFGDQTRERLFHRGQVADLWVRNVKSYAPVPFFMSTRGVAVLVNTTHHVVFDMGKKKADEFSWRDKRGEIDYYIMVGDGFRTLLDLYTSLTGRPKLPPLWAFGLWYICRTQANDCEAVNDALNFRREKIPCDVLGLEPGWMETNYDGSVDKKWSNDRFPIPPYCQKGPHNFFNAIKRMGFRFELWLCNDYDLTYEEERRLSRQAVGNEAVEAKGVFHANAEVDEHFGHPLYADKLTKKDEPWFEHLKKFVDQGADFFKQDGAYQVCEHPDRLWGNGMKDEEAHNLYPLLYSRQMHESFEDYTNRRAVVFTPAGWTGFQAWCGTWTGDTGGRLDTLGAMLNTSFVGHAWSTNDMEVAQPEGIHFGYLQPWSQINSWNYFRMPWVQGDKLCGMHKFYANLRARLIPYIYSWAKHSCQTGWPLMIPLALEFTDDGNCRDNLHQYLLGRDLLVTIYKKEAYFPDGKWKSFWTGEVVEGGANREIDWPSNRGGGLYLRAGAIVPLGPVMQYRGEKPVDLVELIVYPDARETTFELYEDDGVTFAYRDGACTVTEIRTRREGAFAYVKVGETQGDYEGKPTHRKWCFSIAAEMYPKSVSVNGVGLSGKEWAFDEKTGFVRVSPLPGALELKIEF